MIHYIPLDYVLHLHDQLIEEYGGTKGILNLGLLQSALEMPRASFNGKDLHRTIYDKAAAYLFHITKNHPFLDGNKRTAGMVSIVFLASNDIPFVIFNDEYENLILQVARDGISKKEIASFFRNAHKAVSLKPKTK